MERFLPCRSLGPRCAGRSPGSKRLSMATPAQGQIFFGGKIADAFVAYLIKSYTERSRKTLGRTILQKLCYFAKASGVPLPFRFEIYHYGPFSQEIFYRTEDLLLDRVIEDRSADPGQSNFVPGPNLDSFLDQFDSAIRQHETSLKRVATMFSRLDPSTSPPETTDLRPAESLRVVNR